VWGALAGMFAESPASNRTGGRSRRCTSIEPANTRESGVEPPPATAVSSQRGSWSGLSGALQVWDDRAVSDRVVRTREPRPAQLVVENERLQRALRARLEEEQALRRVAMLVAREHAPAAVLTLVTEEIVGQLKADMAATVRYDAPDRATIVAKWTAPHVAPSSIFQVGRQIEIVPQTSLARVHETLAPARVESYEGMPGRFPEDLRKRGIRGSAAAPILVDGHLWGAFAASWTTDIPVDAEARLGAFAELVAQAIANVDARIKLEESRARLVEAADDARRRIERDLHDGAQQQLVALALSLQLVARSAEPATATALQRCIEDLHTALATLRELARGLHPVTLTERGLPAALQALATRSPVPVDVDAELDARLPAAHEAALYFVAAEALTNVAKYAKASAVELTLHSDDRWAEIAVADDGVGGARAENGSGLRGLGDRVEALGGRLTITSTRGHGTTVRARVPIARETSALFSPLV
jgi:signal transduction histidine kinase